MDARFHDENCFLVSYCGKFLKETKKTILLKYCQRTKFPERNRVVPKNIEGGGHTGLWGLKDVALHVQEQNQIILYKISLSMDINLKSVSLD